MYRPATIAVAMLTALSVAVTASPAQRQPAPVEQPASTVTGPAPISGQAAQETREQLERLLEQYPPSLPRVLKLDPTLLTNQAYLEPYPAVGAFLSQHPEISHNPAYFFENFNAGGFSREDPHDRAFNMWRSAMEGFFIAMIFAAIAGALAWLIKTVIDHRRWTRVSKIQTDVHYKLLDRFNSNEDLLAYMQTPAGRRFFEAGPILTETPRALSAPVGRILWSAQVGAVLTLAGLGLEFVASRAMNDVGQPLMAIGVVVIALGIGFAVSALMAYMLSKRLGLLGGEAAIPEPRG